MERRLAAVLIADVVGYSRLMEEDEAGTLAALTERRASILEPTVRAHAGRIVKVMGDGVLIEFGSAVNAVAGALELQRRMAEANEPLPDTRRIVLRIGINLGDVIGEGEDIYGEGVNIAARLEALAEPGGTCISAKVHEEVHGKLSCTFEDMGEQTVKNIARPIRAYRLRPDKVIDGASPGRPVLSLPDKPSIAVLPFQNMSGDSEQEYFADGMVEDITTALSRLRWLFVIARNSSFTYKGRAVDVKQVGRELGVRYVLEGSVRKAGKRVRITGQLIDASTGAHLWADHFDGELADIFDLQDQVTASVVGAIAPKLEQAEIERAKRKPTESLDAYDYFLRGMAAFYRFSKPSNEEALALFSRAIELDPDFASAYGMAARCYLQRKGFGWVTDREREIAEAERLARRAAYLGREDAVALGTAGFALVVVVGDLDDGPALIDRSLAAQSEPGMGMALQRLDEGIPRRTGSRDRAGRPRHASKPAGSSDVRQCRPPPRSPISLPAATTRRCHGRKRRCGSNRISSLRHAWPRQAVRSPGSLPEAEKAMARLRQLNPALRLSNLKELLPIRRPQDFDRWAEGLRKAGLPE